MQVSLFCFELGVASTSLLCSPMIYDIDSLILNNLSFDYLAFNIPTPGWKQENHHTIMWYKKLSIQKYSVRAHHAL